jgi:hypothetical protein
MTTRPQFFFLDPLRKRTKNHRRRDVNRMPRPTRDTEPDSEIFERMRQAALEAKARRAREKYANDEAHREEKQTAARQRYREAHPDHKPHRPRVSAQIAGTVLGATLVAAPFAAAAAAVAYLSG